jgi:sugar lactone lactonase YvrE
LRGGLLAAILFPSGFNFPRLSEIGGNMMKLPISLLLMTMVFLATGCASAPQAKHGDYSLVEVAQSKRQWTGVAVAPNGRIFVNYPRWSDTVPFSVGELRRDGSVVPYPDMELNRWERGQDPSRSFVCVQSVVVDSKGFLWILDPANPQFKGVVPGGPKLVKVDLATDRIVQTVRFAPPVITEKSYLNDVRLDPGRQVAYISDSGAGAIVVVDLRNGNSRRLLADDPSTKAEDVTLTIEGKPWRRPDGSTPQVHVDGIALDLEGDYLYYQALTGRTLYRVPVRSLLDPNMTEPNLARKVEVMDKTGAADGLEFADGKIYLSALEENAIKTFSPADRKIKTLVQGPELAWPDSFAFGPDGALYVTTSQIHRGPNPPEPYKIFRLERDQ